MPISRISNKRKKGNKDFIVRGIQEPVKTDGLFVKHPDCDKMAPKDFLLITRVVKRGVRPLTIAEAHQR